jgi:hypothetical protein
LIKNPWKLHKLPEEQTEIFFKLFFKESKTKDEFTKFLDLLKELTWNDIYKIKEENIKELLNEIEPIILVIILHKKWSKDEVLDYILIQFNYLFIGNNTKVEENRLSYLNSLLGDLKGIGSANGKLIKAKLTRLLKECAFTDEQIFSKLFSLK